MPMAGRDGRERAQGTAQPSWCSARSLGALTGLSGAESSGYWGAATQTGGGEDPHPPPRRHSPTALLLPGHTCPPKPQSTAKQKTRLPPARTPQIWGVGALDSTCRTGKGAGTGHATVQLRLPTAAAVPSAGSSPRQRCRRSSTQVPRCSRLCCLRRKTPSTNC